MVHKKVKTSSSIRARRTSQERINACSSVNPKKNLWKREEKKGGENFSLGEVVLVATTRTLIPKEAI